jgi:hypothetical protein
MSRHHEYRPAAPGAPATLADVEAFAARWHEDQREPWARNGYNAPHMAHDLYNVKQVHEGPKWFRVDNGPPGNASGFFMVRKADGLAFCIKGYGVPDLRKCIGHVTEAFREVAR